jgi:hypothetical protein
MSYPLVYQFFKLPLSKRRDMGDWLGVHKTETMESDLDYGKRVLLAAKSQGKIQELCDRVAAVSED